MDVDVNVNVDVDVDVDVPALDGPRGIKRKAHDLSSFVPVVTAPRRIKVC